MHYACVCVCVRAYACAFACPRARVCVHARVCVRARVRVCVRARVSVCVFFFPSRACSTCAIQDKGGYLTYIDWSRMIT